MRAGICLTPQSCAGQVVGSVWDTVIDSVSSAAGDMLTTLFGWWAKTPPLDLSASYVSQGQQYVILWLAIPVAVLAVLASISWGVLGGGTGWVVDIVRGLLVFGIVTAASISISTVLQSWSSALAKGFLGAVPEQGVGSRYIKVVAISGTQAPMAATFWALVLFLAACAQYLLMLFRDGASLTLTIILPLAAAGQFSRGSALWLPKVLGWQLAFIFYKPAAALVYYIGFNVLGQAKDIQALATAVCIMIAAIVALPAMLGLVSFAASAPPMNSSALGAAATVTGLGVSLAQARPMGGSVSAAAGAMPAGAPPGAAPPSAGGAAAAAGASTPAAKGVKVP